MLFSNCPKNNLILFFKYVTTKSGKLRGLTSIPVSTWDQEKAKSFLAHVAGASPVPGAAALSPTEINPNTCYTLTDISILNTHVMGKDWDNIFYHNNIQFQL